VLPVPARLGGPKAPTGTMVLMAPKWRKSVSCRSPGPWWSQA